MAFVLQYSMQGRLRLLWAAFREMGLKIKSVHGIRKGGGYEQQKQKGCRKAAFLLYANPVKTHSVNGTRSALRMPARNAAPLKLHRLIILQDMASQ